MSSTNIGDLTGSILSSVKTYLGIAPAITAFDAELVLNINGVLASLTQLGIGPDTGFCINDATSLWTDFVGSNDKRYNFLPTFVALKVRLVFDPQTSKTVTDSIKMMIDEYEYRLHVLAESQNN